MTQVMSNHVSVHLDMVLVSVQDRCMVCAKRTIGSETVLDAPMVLLGDEAQVQAHFGLFSNSAPDGTPRWVGHVESHFSPFV